MFAYRLFANSNCETKLETIRSTISRSWTGRCQTCQLDLDRHLPPCHAHTNSHRWWSSTWHRCQSFASSPPYTDWQHVFVGFDRDLGCQEHADRSPMDRTLTAVVPSLTCLWSVIIQNWPKNPGLLAWTTSSHKQYHHSLCLHLSMKAFTDSSMDRKEVQHDDPLTLDCVLLHAFLEGCAPPLS